MASSNEPTGADLYRAAIGERVMTWRETLGISRATLANAAGISTGYLAKIERGKADPTITTMQAIAAGLETTVQEMMDVSGDELGVTSQSVGKNFVAFKK